MPPYINIHTHHPAPGTLSVANIRLPGSIPLWRGEGYFSAGIHPWDAAVAQPEWLDVFRSAPDHLLAIGEIGLDHRPEYAPYEQQAFWFEAQIAIANKLGKPLIIHNVHSTAEATATLRRSARVPVILHSFNGSPEMVRQWLRAVPTVRFSFGPTVGGSPKTQEALRWLAREHPDRFFLETDDDPNVSIEQIYTLTSEITDWSPLALKERIAQNFNLLFPHTDLR